MSTVAARNGSGMIKHHYRQQEQDYGDNDAVPLLSSSRIDGRSEGVCGASLRNRRLGAAQVASAEANQSSTVTAVAESGADVNQQSGLPSQVVVESTSQANLIAWTPSFRAKAWEIFDYLVWNEEGKAYSKKIRESRLGKNNHGVYCLRPIEVARVSSPVFIAEKFRDQEFVEELRSLHSQCESIAERTPQKLLVGIVHNVLVVHSRYSSSFLQKWF